MSNLSNIIEAQQALLAGLARAEKGEISVPDLKPLSGVLGILPQKNDLFATRIRITGGEIPTAKLDFLAGLAEEIKPSYIHLSSRQNFQFHDVTPANAAKVIRDCTANGLPFRGGGGDSFRNIAVSSESGISRESAVDLVPYAKYLTDVIFDWPEAFTLPRKLKIGFASANDHYLALRQDLGFVEAYKKGKLGFAVYGGGGFGRNAAVAVKLLDFIAPNDLARVARAMVELFAEHGDRQNRATARIRYIAGRLGEKEFVKLFLSYFQKHEKDQFPPVSAFAKSWNLRTPPSSGRKPQESEFTPSERVNFNRWRRFATRSNRFRNEVSVLLFVPRGILSVKEFRTVANLLKKFKIPAVRLTVEQNILIPSIAADLLPELYAKLRKLPADLIFSSFKGQLDACIGATVCKAGILDTPPYAVAVSEAIDKYFQKHPGRFTARRANTIVKELHFSGCPNACVAHQAVRYGFQGTRKKIGEKLVDGFTVWYNLDHQPIGVEDPEFIPASELPAKVLSLLKADKLI